MIFIIILLILAIIVVMTIAHDVDYIGECIILFILLFSAIVLILINNSKPKPIDVYRGKTEIVLKENAVGNLDSLIVWKNK